MKAKTAIRLIIEEFHRATAANGEFHSRHEGYAVLHEEVDELWDAVKRNLPDNRLKEEATQVGAMALRFLVDCTYKEEEDYDN